MRQRRQQEEGEGVIPARPRDIDSAIQETGALIKISRIKKNKQIEYSLSCFFFCQFHPSSSDGGGGGGAGVNAQGTGGVGGVGVGVGGGGLATQV